MDFWRKQTPPVVASLLKPDCFTKGAGLGMMGGRYNATINFESCGTITLINSLASLDKNVFVDKKYSPLVDAIPEPPVSLCVTVTLNAEFLQLHELLFIDTVGLS